MSFSEKAWEIFNHAVEDYHKSDDVNSLENNPYPNGSMEAILYSKNWIDTVQWHLEDIIRDELINPVDALVIKRKIDASNQKRTDLVEDIDIWFLNKYQKAKTNEVVRINTETPAWAVDRLSILVLKVYHMMLESERLSASEEHRQKCKVKLNTLLAQKKDLSKAIDMLLSEIEQGKVSIRLYKQMKMYNDESLNPILYQTEKK